MQVMLEHQGIGAQQTGVILVWPLLASGRVKPEVTHTLPLAQAADAHRLLESGDVVGKIVLTVG